MSKTKEEIKQQYFDPSDVMKLDQAMDVYAKQEAIEFNKFAIGYFLTHIKGSSITDDELYSIYLQSKTK